MLNGLVFVILGTQLPEILESVRLNAQIDGRIVLVDVLAITAALMLIRFGWAYFTLPRESLVGESKPLSRVRAGLVTTMAGVRGAVTLASALSLPFVLADGSPFPFRETIIFIASMVILLSLLIANFLLPLLLDSATEHGSAEELTDARIDLLQGVVRRLNAQSTSENAFATSQMVREYYVRISELENKRGWSRAERELEAKLHQQALEWEKENTLSYIEQNHLDAERTEGLLDFIDASSREWRKRATPVYRRVTRYLNFFRSERRFQGSEADHMIRWQDTHAILHSNTAYVMQHLRALEDATNRRVVDKMVADYELAADLFEQRFAVVTGSKLNQTAGAPAQDGLHIAEVTKLAMQLERDGIQSLFEEGRISRAAAAEMRNNLGMVALRLQQQFFLEEEDLAPA